MSKQQLKKKNNVVFLRTPPQNIRKMTQKKKRRKKDNAKAKANREERKPATANIENAYVKAVRTGNGARSFLILSSSSSSSSSCSSSSSLRDAKREVFFCFVSCFSLRERFTRALTSHSAKR